MAKQLSGRRESARDRDANKTKSKKAAALAALKKEKKIQLQQKGDESSEDSSGFDDDDDEDSDDDYEESLKPWQSKAKTGKVGTARLDEEQGSDDEMELDKDEKPKKSKLLSQSSDDVSRSRGAEATLEDFLKVTIPRRRLARWCNEPFFNAAVLECFVRLFIGEDEKNRKVYRLCEVVDVLAGSKTYKFPVTDKNSKPVSTNKMIRVKFGNSSKEVPMFLVSDSPPTELDVQKYLTAQKNVRGAILSKRRAAKLRRLQDELVLNYTYTTEDIERNLQARKKQGKSLANLGLEQTKMAIAVQAARDSLEEAKRLLEEAKRKLMEGDGFENDLEKSVTDAQKVVEAAEKTLQEKEEEEKALTEHVEQRKRKLTQRSRDKNWAKVNQRALQMNQRADREAGKYEKEAKEARELAGTKEEFNPYARRQVKPKILWEVGQANEEEKTEEEKKQSEEKAAMSKFDTPKENQTETPALVHEPNEKAAALSESHQFAIDEEGLVQSSVTVGLGFGKNKNQSQRLRVRRGLSLSDYLERKAAGTL